MASNSSFYKNTKYLALGFILLLIVTALFLVMLVNKSQLTPPPSTKNVDLPAQQTTLEGQMTCLPRIPGPDGSAMSDCVYGLKTDKGVYYFVEDRSNGNTDQWYESPLYTANKVRINGKLTTQKSEEFYTTGTIVLESFTILEAAPTNQPEEY